VASQDNITPQNSTAQSKSTDNDSSIYKNKFTMMPLAPAITTTSSVGEISLNMPKVF